MTKHLNRTSPLHMLLPAAARVMIFTLLLSHGAPMQADEKTGAEAGKTDSGQPAETDADAPDPRIVQYLESAQPLPQGMLDTDAEWLNTSRPISLKDLRGKVVLLDFWTYCCINCMHVLPDLKKLEEKYANQLVVIGVHSAKFDNEKLTENIREAILRYEIKHPVVNDNDMTLWRRFGVRGWPTLALIDPEGRYIGKQSGEGNFELFDHLIGEVIKYHCRKGTLDETPLVFELEQGTDTRSALRFPGKLFADAETNRLFIADSNHNRIVVCQSDGTLIDTIGSGKAGLQDGDFRNAQFDHPQGLTLVGHMLYVADTENHCLRTVDLQQKTVRTLAGTGEQGRPGDTGGPLQTARLNSPWDVCAVNDALYIAMAGPHQIWVHRFGTDQISVYAGNGREDVINGPLLQASFAQPSGLTVDDQKKFIYVADSEGSAIRRVPVDSSGIVTTVAGTSELPRGQSLFAFGDKDGIGPAARFQHPLGVAWHQNAVYVADTYNHKIRKVDLKTKQVTTWLGTGQRGQSLTPVQLNEPAGLSVAGTTLFIADTNNHRILAADLNTSEVREVVIPELKPPTSITKSREPADSALLEVKEHRTAPTAPLTVTIELNVPEGGKLNDLAPLTAVVRHLSGDAIIEESVLDRPTKLSVDGEVASLQIPLASERGTALISVAVSYGYCDKDNEGLCRLASAAWKIPLVVADDAAATPMKLSFPIPAAKKAVEPDSSENEP